MERRKLFVTAAGVGIAAIGSVAALAPLAVYAAETTTNPQDSFIQKLAEKLGIDVTTVQTAFDSTQDEIRTEMEAQQAEEIAQAVTDGTLTQRQADILNGISDAMERLKPETGEAPTDVKEDLSDLTEEERDAKFQEMRDAHDQELVDALNEAGLNTTLEEVQSTQQAARDAGIRAGMHMRGGPGRGFGGPGIRGTSDSTDSAE